MPEIYLKLCKPYALPWTAQPSSGLLVKDSFTLMFNKNDIENSFIISSMFFGVGTISLLTFVVLAFTPLKKKRLALII